MNYNFLSVACLFASLSHSPDDRLHHLYLFVLLGYFLSEGLSLFFVFEDVIFISLGICLVVPDHPLILFLHLFYFCEDIIQLVSESIVILLKECQFGAIGIIDKFLNNFLNFDDLLNNLFYFYRAININWLYFNFFWDFLAFLDFSLELLFWIL